jgi:4'-phosphopantetheinyl transferase
MADDLGPSQVHIWFYAWDQLLTPSRMNALYPTLSRKEREQHGRFHFDKDRQIYLLAHVLLRRALSQYEDAPETCWEFAREKHGKPFIVSPVCAPLSFNLTHTSGLVACAISRQQVVGVDAERMDRSGFLEIAPTVLAPVELHTLSATPEAGQAEQFCTYWTLKEAYVKAHGSGLSTDLQDFAVHIDNGSGAAVEFLHGEHQDPEDWQLRLFRPTPSHILAVALRMRGPAKFILHEGAALMR